MSGETAPWGTELDDTGLRGPHPDDYGPDDYGPDDLDRPGAAPGSPDGPATAPEEAQYLDACVTDVQAWLGPELTAYLAGAESPAELVRWSSAAVTPQVSAAGRRLRAASEVVELFAAAGRGTRAQSWLREVSELTAGRSPAHLIRHARTERLLEQVREAAERHLTERPVAAV